MFEVERLIKRRIRKGRVEYLARWEDLDEGHDTWIPEGDVNKAALDQFEGGRYTAPLRRSERLQRRSMSARIILKNSDCPRTGGYDSGSHPVQSRDDSSDCKPVRYGGDRRDESHINDGGSSDGHDTVDQADGVVTQGVDSSGQIAAP